VSQSVYRVGTPLGKFKAPLLTSDIGRRQRCRLWDVSDRIQQGWQRSVC